MKPIRNSSSIQHHTAWDRYAEDYASLGGSGGIYDLTKRLMHRVVVNAVSHLSGQLQVLDVNCGTGNDFPYFLKKGWHITGTDGSEGMLALAAKTYHRELESGSIKLFQTKLEDWNSGDLPEASFDLIFSVTGGFSYIDDDELLRVNAVLGKLLKPGGRLVVANLNAYCFGEQAWFLLKQNRQAAFRRKSGGIPVNIKDETMRMYLRSPQKLRELYSESFKVEKQVPLLGLTPPYQSGYNPPQGLLKFHETLEKMLQDLGWFNAWADQVITVAKMTKDHRS